MALTVRTFWRKGQFSIDTCPALNARPDALWSPEKAIASRIVTVLNRRKLKEDEEAWNVWFVIGQESRVRFKFRTLAKRNTMIFRCFEMVLYLQFGIFWREGRCQLEVLYFIPYVELTNWRNVICKVIHRAFKGELMPTSDWLAKYYIVSAVCLRCLMVYIHDNGLESLCVFRALRFPVSQGSQTTTHPL